MAAMKSPVLMSGFGGGRVVDRRDHLHQTVFHRHFDAEAAEFALGLDLHVGEGLRVHVAGMRIERRDHAFDGVVDELLVLDRADIVLAHLLERGAEQIELMIGGEIVSRHARPETASTPPQTRRRHPTPTNAYRFMIFLPS